MKLPTTSESTPKPPPMPQQDQHLAIVFSDIVGSSQLYSALGDTRAKEKIDLALLVMRELVAQSKGRVVKTLGDEIMFAHEDPEHACNCIVRMNCELNRIHFYLRTGMSYGRVISDKGDVYGDAVNSAAFIARTAQANQILLDANTYANLVNLRQKCEFFDRITLKGQAEPSLLYRLNWEQRDTLSLDATMVANNAITTEFDMPTQLLISHLGNTYYVKPSNQLSIGRDHGSVQLCVKHRKASRKHCTLSYHHGKFVLADHSTNGTYLLQNGQQEVFLKRESTTVSADGIISIGQPSKNSDIVLHYHID